jgi:hypothetical protein
MRHYSLANTNRTPNPTNTAPHTPSSQRRTDRLATNRYEPQRHVYASQEQ